MSRSLRTTRTAVVLLMITLLCALWLVVLGTIWGERKRTLEANERFMGQLNAAVEEQTLGLMRLIETCLGSANMWIEHHPDENPCCAPGFIELVESYRKRSGGLVDIRLVTRKGELQYVGVQGARGPLADVSDREYYMAQLYDTSRGFFIGQPIKSRVTGKWGVPISVPVLSQKSPVAVLFCMVELERVAALHEAVRIKPHGTVSILRTDGVSLSRVPFREGIVGQSLAGTPQFKTHLEGRERGFAIWSTTLDGVDRFVSHARLSQYPLIVVVTNAVDAVLAPWNKLVLGLVALAIAASVMGVYLGQRLFMAMADKDAAHAAMQRLASTDTLTGLMNRYAFMAAAKREQERARRNGRGLSVLMIDMDHFKAINDTHGHAVGDRVLRSLGRMLTELLRSIDTAGRLGGEEFCVLLPETDLKSAAEVAERLRRECEIRPVRIGGLDLTKTLSVGVAELAGTEETATELIHRADLALYRAKKNGRNRVELADDPAPTGFA